MIGWIETEASQVHRGTAVGEKGHFEEHADVFGIGNRVDLDLHEAKLRGIGPGKIHMLGDARVSEVYDERWPHFRWIGGRLGECRPVQQKYCGQKASRPTPARLPHPHG